MIQHCRLLRGKDQWFLKLRELERILSDEDYGRINPAST